MGILLLITSTAKPLIFFLKKKTKATPSLDDCRFLFAKKVDEKKPGNPGETRKPMFSPTVGTCESTK